MLRTKEFLKKCGKIPITLNQINEREIYRKALIIDGSFILPNNFALIIGDTKGEFSNCRLTALTFKDKEKFIKDNFPNIEVMAPHNKLKMRKYQLGITLLLLLLQKKFNFIILSSLDISIVPIALIFARCPIFLHNRWLEWHRLRLRTISDILLGVKSADKNRRRGHTGLKDVLKSIGRIFVILSKIDTKDKEYPILLLDNGYTDISHVTTALRRLTENYFSSTITVLTFSSRKHFFNKISPHTNVIGVKEYSHRYALALEMYRMRKSRFASIVLTALDISPVIVAFLFMHSDVFLYNKWHQWWKLRFRTSKGYIKGISKILFTIPIFIYLLIRSGFILLRVGFKVSLIDFSYNIPKDK